MTVYILSYDSVYTDIYDSEVCVIYDSEVHILLYMTVRYMTVRAYGSEVYDGV